MGIQPELQPQTAFFTKSRSRLRDRRRTSIASAIIVVRFELSPVLCCSFTGAVTGRDSASRSAQYAAPKLSGGTLPMFERGRLALYQLPQPVVTGG